MTFDSIVKIFNAEYQSVSHKFVHYNLTVQEVNDTQDDFIWHPGVYIWFQSSQGILKVGRSLSNSRKRALEHIASNTGGIIRSIAEEKDTRIFLFNVINPDDYHWVASLEIYFENKLNPLIKSGCQG